MFLSTYLVIFGHHIFNACLLLTKTELCVNWKLQDLMSVPPMYIFAAIVPALMVTGLYFFDHSVASQMAQQKEFNLKNPSAYHYDILILGVMVFICSLSSFILYIHIYPYISHDLWRVHARYSNFRFWFVGYLESLLQMGFSLSPPCTQRAFLFSRGRCVKFCLPYCCFGPLIWFRK